MSDDRLRRAVRLGGVAFLGFCLSAASLGNLPQPIAMAVLCGGLPGWLPIPFVAGAALGYGAMWSQMGMQSLVWLAAALPVSVLCGREKLVRRFLMLQSGLAGAIVAVDAPAFELVGVDGYNETAEGGDVVQAVENEITIALDAIINVSID